MDLREFDASGPFKRSTRMPLDAVVRLHFEGTVAYQNGFAANVSATGMFVKHPDPPPIGTRLVFEFVTGEQRKPVQGAGLVAWVRERYEGPGRPAGIGIQFTEVDSQSRQHIAEALFEFLEASLGGEDLEREAGPEPSPALPALVPLAAAPPAEAEPEPPYGARPAPTFAMAIPAGAAEPPSGFSPAIPPDPPVPPVPEPARDRRATFSYADSAPEPAATESEEARVERLVRNALAEEPFAGAAAARSEDAGGRWIAIAVVAVLLAVGGWAAWRYLSSKTPAPERPTATAALPAPTPTPRPPLAAVAEPQTTLAAAVGATDAAVTAPETPLPAGAPADDAGDEGEATPANDANDANDANNAGKTGDASVPADAEPDPTPAAPVVKPRPIPPATAAAAAPADEGAPRARALTDIDWTEATGITVVTLAGDGVFPVGSYSYSEIGDDKPRVLVRFKGLDLAYRKAGLTVGTGAVAAIRTGWHDRPGGAEQHVVIDLAGGNVRLEGFEALGSRIVLKLAAR
jgi:uncharacterized protein (TIGR02266 family)